MREDQILSACVDVDRIAEVFAAHHGALDVPARPPLPPGRFPVGLAFFFRLPEDKIQRILLEVSGHLDVAVSALQVIDVFMGKLPVILELPRAVVNRAVLHRVGIAFFDQRFDHRDHPVDLLGCLRMRRRRLHVEGCHILFAFFDIALADLGCRKSLLVCLFDDLVIHVRKVGNVVDVVSLVLHVTPEGVKHDHRTRVADVDQIVDRRPADIHGQFLLPDRLKLFFCPG